MKKFIAFLRFLQLIFTGLSISMKQCLGYRLPVFECEKEKMACFTEEGETVGAIFHAPDYLPSEKGVIISFNCEDIDQTLEKVLRKGGKIMMPKTKIEVEGRGWFALFADSEGNRVGLYADK